MSTKTQRRSTRAQAGYSLVETLIAMGIMSVVLGATMAGLSDAIRANDAILQSTGLNNSARIAMDLVVRDLLQVGAGLPPNHAVSIPNGAGATAVKLPGPPGTSFATATGQEEITAVLPGPGLGPEINGVATDMVTFLTSDNAFTDVGITNFTNSSVTVSTVNPMDPSGPPLNIASGPDRVVAGQLMLIEKHSFNTLVQVTGVNYATRVISFGTDSLNLNQSGAEFGNLKALNTLEPPTSPLAAAAAAMRITRIRMISYYLDTEVQDRPRLIRRINNGDADVFDNTLGTAVALDVENLQFTYDLQDGETNPSGIRFTAADYTLGYDPRTIRKVNLSLTGRSRNGRQDGKSGSYRTVLTTQVSLRGMAFVDQYRAP